MNDEEKVVSLTEQGDFGLGVTELTEEEKKKLEEAQKKNKQQW